MNKNLQPLRDASAQTRCRAEFSCRRVAVEVQSANADAEFLGAVQIRAKLTAA